MTQNWQPGTASNSLRKIFTSVTRTLLLITFHSTFFPESTRFFYPFGRKIARDMYVWEGDF